MKANTGIKIFTIKFNTPETLNILIATNNPIKVGNISSKILIEDLAPSKKFSKVFFFSLKDIETIKKIIRGTLADITVLIT